MRRHPPLPQLLPPLRALACYSLLLIIAAPTFANPTYAGDGGNPETASAPCRVTGGGCLKVTGGPGSHLQATFGGDVADQ